MTIHGIATLALGLVLFYLRSIMTSLFSYAIGGAFAVLLIAASLLFTASADWICATALGYRQVSKLRSLLFLCTAAFACTASLILSPGSTIRILCYAQAIYALSLSIGKLGLARSWYGSKTKQAVMYFLAGGTFASSAALVAFAGRGDRESLAWLATYYLFVGFEMLLTMYLLEKQRLKLVEPTSGLNQPIA